MAGAFTDEEIETGNWIRELSERSERGIKAFYHTGIWGKKRIAILERDHYSCQECRKKGFYKKAVTVHHIKHLRDVPELALTDSNLISLCADCHDAMHPEKHYTKGEGFTNCERW